MLGQVLSTGIKLLISLDQRFSTRGPPGGHNVIIGEGGRAQANISYSSIYLHYVVFLPFSQKPFRLLYLLNWILSHNLKCKYVTWFYQPQLYFVVFLVFVIIPNSQFPKCTKTRIKSHKTAHKTSKNLWQLGLGEFTSYFVERHGVHRPRKGDGLGRGQGPKRLRTTALDSGHKKAWHILQRTTERTQHINTACYIRTHRHNYCIKLSTLVEMEQ